jgi:hypothetical protein
VKRLLAALAGILGIAWLRNRSKPAPAVPQPDPAEELRAKLAETRVDDPAPQIETGPAPEVAPQGDVATRRQDVHERARAATKDLAGSDE